MDNFNLKKYISEGKIHGFLKEAFVDKGGNLISESDFVILEGGMRGGNFKSKEEINVEDYINFTTKLEKFRKKDIANKIYKQVLEIYNKSSLKEYNNIKDSTPKLTYDKGGGWDASAYSIELTKGLILMGALESNHYYPDTGFDDYIKGMRKALDVDDSEWKDDEEIKNQKKDSERKGYIEDLEDKVISLKVICIPKYFFEGKIISMIDSDINTNNDFFGDKHNLYSKHDLLKDLNDLGLFLISNSSKSQIVDLNDSDYDLYQIKVKAKFTGYRKDGTSYNMNLGGENGKTDIYYLLAPKGKEFKSFLHNKGDKSEFNLYNYLYGWEETNGENNIKNIKKDIKKFENIKLSLNLFNYLKKNNYTHNESGNEYGEKINMKNGVLMSKNLN